MISIDPIQFLIQAAALAACVVIAAAIYAVVERYIADLDDHSTSLLTAYVLWLSMGVLGAHRIFCRHIISGLGQLLLTFVLFLASLAFGYYYVFAAPAVLWWLYDATQIQELMKNQEPASATAAPGN